MFKFGERSIKNLDEVHADLQCLAKRALELSEIDFAVTEGVRSAQEQEVLVAKGASWTMSSRHLTGHAIDVMAFVNGKGRWEWPLYEKISDAFTKAGLELGIPFVWGGTWKSKDGPHFELRKKEYPA